MNHGGLDRVGAHGLRKLRKPHRGQGFSKPEAKGPSSDPFPLRAEIDLDLDDERRYDYRTAGYALRFRRRASVGPVVTS